jgi:hypothetical protein
MMSELLDQIVAAHGGLSRWESFDVVKAKIATGGAFWAMKGLVQDSTPREMTVWLHEQRASVMPYGAANQRSAYVPERVAVETLAGDVIAERTDPKDSFAGHEMRTPWDPLHRAYFNGYALWTYLTSPFLLTWPGVEVEEVKPWKEGRETWRRLRVRFPATIATHTQVQDFFFDETGMLRRHDYRVDIAGGFAAVQLIDTAVEVQGLRVPTRRRAYLRREGDRPDLNQLMVSIDLSDIRYTVLADSTIDTLT